MKVSIHPSSFCLMIDSTTSDLSSTTEYTRRYCINYYPVWECATDLPVNSEVHKLRWTASNICGEGFAWIHPLETLDAHGIYSWEPLFSFFSINFSLYRFLVFQRCTIVYYINKSTSFTGLGIVHIFSLVKVLQMSNIICSLRCECFTLYKYKASTVQNGSTE